MPCSGPVMGMFYVIMATTVRSRHHATMTTDSRHLSEGNSFNSIVSSALFGLVKSILMIEVTSLCPGKFSANISFV